jgi:hypothetical protein
MPEPLPHVRFRNILWIRILSVVIAIPFVLQSFALIYILLKALTGPAGNIGRYVASVCVLVGVVILSLLVSALAVIPVIHVLFGYLDVSEAGLEYYQPLFRRVRCSWKDMTGVATVLIIAPTRVILYAQADEHETRLNRLVGRFFKNRPPNYIPLSGFAGWPDGRLQELLQQYAPHLFE